MDEKQVLDLMDEVVEMKKDIELLARRVLIHKKQLDVLGEDYEDRVINASRIAKEVEDVLYG